MDVNGETEIYAVELGDKIEGQIEQGAVDDKLMFQQIFWYVLISNDGYVATAYSKGFLKTCMMYPFCHAREFHQLKLLQAVVHCIPTKLHLKEGGKVKARAIAPQVWWRRRQDYLAMWQNLLPQQIRRSPQKQILLVGADKGERRYQLYPWHLQKLLQQCIFFCFRRGI